MGRARTRLVQSLTSLHLFATDRRFQGQSWGPLLRGWLSQRCEFRNCHCKAIANRLRNGLVRRVRLNSTALPLKRTAVSQVVKKMSSISQASDPPTAPRFNPDRIGIAASVFCAIHCIATPLLILCSPSIARAWAHPASHWLVALLVVPLALVMLARGYRRHGRAWIPVTGGLGVLFVVLGAIIPFSGAGKEGKGLVYIPAGAQAETVASCSDSCCPAVSIDESGITSLTIPYASIVTTLGGLALILAHAGNLRCCYSCSRCNSTPT